MQTSVTPVRENGRVLNHIWVHTDVTEQKVRISYVAGAYPDGVQPCPCSLTSCTVSYNS